MSYYSPHYRSLYWDSPYSWRSSSPYYYSSYAPYYSRYSSPYWRSYAAYEPAPVTTVTRTVVDAPLAPALSYRSAYYDSYLDYPSYYGGYRSSYYADRYYGSRYYGAYDYPYSSYRTYYI